MGCGGGKAQPEPAAQHKAVGPAGTQPALPTAGQPAAAGGQGHRAGEPHATANGPQGAGGDAGAQKAAPPAGNSAAAAAPSEGLDYDRFAALAFEEVQSSAHLKGAEKAESPKPHHGSTTASMMMQAGGGKEECLKLWARTGLLLDRPRRGVITWDDVENAVRELGEERDQATLVMDILQTITKSRVRLRHIFIALDKDATGMLEKNEWDDGIVLLLGTTETEDIPVHYRDRIWQVLDEDNSKSVSYAEFLQGLSVEDTWGLHPDSRTAPEALDRKKKGQQMLTQGDKPEKPRKPREPSCADADPKNRAARIIVRFMRRAKAHRVFEAQIWHATLRALDLVDEVELNTSDGGSAKDDDSDDEKEEGDGEVRHAVQELEVVVKDLLLKKLPPLPVAKAVIQAVTMLHHESPNVGHIAEKEHPKVVIVGDLHGQLEDLLHIFESNGQPSELSSTLYLFNGDFVDRGPHGVEVLLLLYTLKLLWPGKVFLNRGNHEAKRINEKYGFDEEVQEKYNHSIFKLITKSFNALPLCHIVYGKIFVVHGGLSDEQDVSIADYDTVDRFRQPPRRDEIAQGQKGRYERLFEAAMWSDPRELPDGQATEPSKRGAGCHFGEPAVKRFLDKNNLKRFVRSHEVYQPGYMDHHNRLTTTVFSASNYCGTDDNHGCYLVCNSSEGSDMPELQYVQYRISCNAILELREEVQEAVKAGVNRLWRVAPKEDSLRRLRGLIFCRRSELMHHFQQHDSQRTGKVTTDGWVDAMKTCCSPLPPWRCLQKHLAPHEHDGSVAYVPFLERFQNTLARRWMTQWGNKMMRHMAERMMFATKNLISQQKAGSKASLSYYQMCEALRSCLPGLSETAVYYLMALCDENKDGFIELEEFQHAVEKSRKSNDEECPPGLLDLWDFSTFDPIGFCGFQKAFFMAMGPHGERIYNERYR